MTALVHLGSGIGNIVFATPLLVALDEMGIAVDVLLDADYPETASLFDGWSAVRRVVRRLEGTYDYSVPALPPFYWPQRARKYAGHVLRRPPASLFERDEQAFYIDFAKQLGYEPANAPAITLPVAPAPHAGVSAATAILAPGSKTGEMTAKRWPWFAELAGRLSDVVVAGTEDDSTSHRGLRWDWPGHARVMLGKLSLRETAEMLAAAGVVVANDTGLAYVAAAVGTPVVILYGPTPAAELGALPPYVRQVRPSLPCAPCWRGARLQACCGRLTCLEEISVGMVLKEMDAVWGEAPAAAAP
jgi:ADP-heptose:LPS heptosyltransferase